MTERVDFSHVAAERGEVDLLAIEREAARLRAEALAGLFAAFGRWLVGLLSHANAHSGRPAHG